MLEAICRVVSHANLFHDAPRTGICGDGKRDDFIHPQGVKRMMEHGGGRFGGETSTPVVSREAPSDLHARGEVRFKGRPRQARKSRKLACGAQFCGKEGEPVISEMRVNSIREGIALRSRKKPGKELHDARIGIHAGERLTVCMVPGPQPEALRLENNHSPYASVSIG